MDKKIFEEEKNYLLDTISLTHDKLKKIENFSTSVKNMMDNSTQEYHEYLKRNSNKLNEEDVVELYNMQGRLEDLQTDIFDYEKDKSTYTKMLNKPYFARIDIKDREESLSEKYYIGIHSLVDDNKNYRIVDWRSPIASIFYDYEEGDCAIKTNSSVLRCRLENKRQFGIADGKLDYYIDTTINIEDELLQEALAKNTTSQMKSIVQTIQREQNEIIRCDASKTLIVQGVAGSGKTAIALHRIAYLLYRYHDKIKSENIKYISPNSAFSSYISSVLPDLAEDDVEKLQLDDIARMYLKKHLILEKRFEQIERLIGQNNIDEYNYKISYKFLQELLDYAYNHYIDNFNIDDFEVKDKIIDSKKIKDLFFNKYSDRDLFTRFKWITDNIFDMYFYKVRTPNSKLKIKEYIFRKLYSTIVNKNCVKAYMNFLAEKNMKIELVGNKVKNEDAYAILLFKIFIYGADAYDNVEHLVIDEMQDYSAVQIYIISKLFNCTKTILGDFNQTINPESIAKIQEDYSKIVTEDNIMITLNKSYRSTKEIANFYNFIGKKTNAKVVERHGEQVDLYNTNKNDSISLIVKLVNEYKNKGYNSIAIITKSNKDARELYSLVENKIEKINLIDDNTDCYDNNTCIISTFNSKGLEFDGVIVYNVSDNFKSNVDRNLLYIASTRALHKLSIISIDSKCKFIEEFKEKI